METEVLRENWDGQDVLCFGAWGCVRGLQRLQITCVQYSLVGR